MIAEKINKAAGLQMIFLYGLLCLSLTAFAQQGLKQDQLRYPRVREARDHSDSTLRRDLEQKGLPYPPKAVYLRAFKSEAVMELWVEKEDGTFGLFRKYPVCAMSGYLGPKREQGDQQVPEGLYFLSRFNPHSQFYLSLKVNYPNAVDRRRSKASRLGGDIYIHGECVSIGCLAMTTPLIKEIYWLTVLAGNQGQSRIPCHIFPSRLNQTKYAILELTYGNEHVNFELWKPLSVVYQYFDEHRRLPRYNISAVGRYVVAKEE